MDVRHLDNLPFDIVVEIFKYLSLEDLVLCMQNVSKHWHNMVQDSILWREISFKPCLGLRTETVVSLLKQAPLLRSFEFQKGLEQSEVFNVLCEHNPCITSLAFETYDSDVIGKLISRYPDLEYLKLPSCVFVNHLSLISKLKKLKKIKCVQSKYQNSSLTVINDCAIIEESDWSSLESLELSSDNTDNRFDEMMVKVRGQLVNLEIQTIHSSEFLEHIQHCLNLEVLKINFTSRQMSDADINTFFTNLKHLTNLKCLCVSSFVHADIDILCRAFHKSKYSMLSELKLDHCRNFSSKLAKDIADACPQMEIIHINGCRILDDTCLREFSRCTHLRVLSIPGCRNITELGLSYLTNCLHLSKLNLSWIGLVSAPMLVQIAKIKGLSILEIDNTEIDSTHLIDTVKKLPNLRLLSVYRTRDVDGQDFQKRFPHCYVRYVRRNYYHIMKEKALSLRKLHFNALSQSVLNILPYSKNLEELSINFVHYPCIMFPRVFMDLKCFGKLKKLSLKAFATKDDFILGEMLSGEGLSELRELSLENCPSVNSDVMMKIADHNSQLEILRLSGCLSLTDDGLASFVKITSLCVLDISGCSSLTETGLLCLSKCKSLVDLNVSGVLRGPSDILKCILLLPKLSCLHLENNGLLDKYMKGKNWKNSRNEGRIVTYVPYKKSPLS